MRPRLFMNTTKNTELLNTIKLANIGCTRPFHVSAGKDGSNVFGSVYGSWNIL